MIDVGIRTEALLSRFLTLTFIAPSLAGRRSVHAGERVSTTWMGKPGRPRFDLTD
jgi:hypothetical protein